MCSKSSHAEHPRESNREARLLGQWYTGQMSAPYRNASTRILAYQDFAPAPLSTSFLGTVFEPFEDVASKATRWVSEKGIDVVNVETATLTSRVSGSIGEEIKGVRIWFWRHQR